MNVSFYKEFFEIELRHASSPGEICTSFSLTPSVKCKSNFQNFRMTYKKSPGQVMVFYSGIEIPHGPGDPPKLDPFPKIPAGTEFLFLVSTEKKDILKITKTLPETEWEDLGKVIPRQFIKPAVFSFTFDHNASTKLYEPFIVEKDGVVVYETTIKKTGIVDNTSNGSYLCSVDLSFSDAGIYSLKLGSKVRNYYVDTTGEMDGNYGFIRFKTDATWKNPTDLRFGFPVDYNEFPYIFELPS